MAVSPARLGANRRSLAAAIGAGIISVGVPNLSQYSFLADRDGRFVAAPLLALKA